MTTMEHFADPWEGGVSIDELTRQDIWSLRRGFLSRRFGDVKGWRVLEVGSGPGHDSLYFAERGATVTAVDYSHSGLQTANRIYRDLGLTVTAVRTDARALPFRSDEFDMVFNAGVLEHFEDDPLKTIISEMIRVAKPNGWVLAFCPNRYNVFYQTHLRRIHGHRYEYERAFAAKELGARFERAGLREVSASGIHVHPAFNYLLPEWLPKHHRIEPWMRYCFSWFEGSDRFDRVKSLIGQDFVVWGRKSGQRGDIPVS